MNEALPALQLLMEPHSGVGALRLIVGAMALLVCIVPTVGPERDLAAHISPLLMSQLHLEHHGLAVARYSR